jgi:hypothetical protein
MFQFISSESAIAAALQTPANLDVRIRHCGMSEKLFNRYALARHAKM